MCYPQPGVATGRAFACEDKWQPSLQILVRELGIDLKDQSVVENFDGNLQHWVDQGVMLMNVGLTCEQWKPNTHTKLWEPFIVETLKTFNDLKFTREGDMNSLVFVFLGSTAQALSNNISESIHYKVMRYHPAAETYGGNKFTGFFNEVNQCLIQSQQEPIKWTQKPVMDVEVPSI